MATELSLKKPWLIAVWPGMGHVALSAGYYLLAKLGMQLVAEFSPRELFEVEHVEVKEGLIRMGRLPRSRFFVWRNPQATHDVVVFLGEAQPPSGKHAFCQKLIDFARKLEIERVFTFAAMATQMHPERESRVFGAATDEQGIAELKALGLEILQGGHIGGLNGVLLGVAAENGLRGTCLLGEMPHIFAQLPFPKAALAVLEAFSKIADITVDLTELSEQVKAVEEQLGELLGQLEAAMGRTAAPEEESYAAEPAEEEEALSRTDQQRIEQLFRQATEDRSKAYELKRELDRLNVFKEFEDRFLDLFKKPQ